MVFKGRSQIFCLRQNYTVFGIMDLEFKWYLAAKFLTNSLTDDEKLAWDDLLETDRVFYLEFQTVEAQWYAAENLHTVDSHADWKLVLEKIRKGKSSYAQQTSRTWLKYAAAILLVVCLAGSVVWFFRPHNAPMQTVASRTRIEAPAGSKTFVTLPDGSTVWLNAGSKLSFDNAFSNNNRDLELVGEAFFDVVKSDIPFTVHTQAYDIAVLGTAFNVSAYPEDPEFVTTLVRGSLKVIRNASSGSKEEILLKPNEQVRLANQPKQKEEPSSPVPAPSKEKLVVETVADVVKETAWKDEWLVMQGESLEALSRRMERLYNIKIKFEEEGLKSYRYTGRIRQLSLEQVLKALALTSPVDFTVDEQTVVFSENKETKSKYRQSLQTQGTRNK